MHLDLDPEPGSFGFVLCGGRSRRMGTDKASLVLDGVPMARRVADALTRAGIDHVAAVGGSRSLASEVGVAHVADRWPGEGPLGAIITALEVAGPDASAVVLPCDLLTPSPTAIRHVLAVRQRTAADAAVPVVAGRRQWLHAAWHGRVETILSDVFASGERSVVGATLGLRMVTIDDVAEAALADADTPADLPAPAEDRAGHERPRALPTIGFVDIPTIDIPTLQQRLEDGDPVFDVRQPDEYEESHVPGVRLVPLDEVPERVEEFPDDRTVYVICRTGGRSGKAVEFLRTRGVDAVNVSGGTLAWIEAGNAVETGA